MSTALSIIPVPGMGEIRPGDDLARLILAALAAQGERLQPDDVLVVTQKVVSKAEGRLARLADVEPSDFASRYAAEWDKDPRHVEVVLRESRRIVKMDKGVLITETRHGLICANSGVDESNVGDETLSLLPLNPDASARAIRARVRALADVDVAVVISDTFGRPWRHALTNVAIGVAGMHPIRNYIGQTDPHGMSLRVTELAVADELAAAAELVMGKLDRVPVAIVRGANYERGEGSAAELIRPPDRDLFR